MRTLPRRLVSVLAPLALVATGLTAGLATELTTQPAAASAAGRAGGTVSREVVFSLINDNTTSAACVSDGATYQVRGRLVGPRREVLGASVDRVGVLVHDLGTDGSFWNLRAVPAYDYATRLAAAGETSLVLDRLGYGESRLADGNDTCLGAQADLLHQVVQHLRSGLYRFDGSAQGTPAAESVVLQGHSTGAAIAQLEAGTYDDVDGLVLMSWTDTGATQRAVDEASQQSQRCLEGQDFARFAGSDREYRALMFRTSPPAVQRAAARRRVAAPCGDVLSLGQTTLVGPTAARAVEAPVLLLFGSRDRLTSRDAEARQADSYTSAPRVRRVSVTGAGSALPLERSAAATRTRVLRWLGTLG